MLVSGMNLMMMLERGSGKNENAGGKTNKIAREAKQVGVHTAKTTG